MKGGTFAAEVKVRGIDKVSRTILATPVAKQGKIFIHVSIWEKLLLDERQGILGFPAKPFKDLNDAFVQMVNRHWPFTQMPEEKPRYYNSEQEYFDDKIFNPILERAQRGRVTSTSI